MESEINNEYMKEDVETKQTDSPSKIFGIIGFALSLIGLLFILFFNLIGLVICIVALILCIIQLVKGKTGLAIAGLIISIILILFGAVFIFLHPLMISHIKAEVGKDVTICLDLMMDMRVINENSCKDENNIEIKIERGSKDFNIMKIDFIFTNDYGESFRETSYDVPTPKTKEIYLFTYPENYQRSEILEVSIEPFIEINRKEQSCGVLTFGLKDC